MESYQTVCEARFAYLADALNLCSTNKSQKEKAASFVESIFKLNKALGIPERIEKLPSSAVDEICAAGFKEYHGTYPVTQYYTKEQAKVVLGKVCEFLYVLLNKHIRYVS